MSEQTGHNLPPGTEIAGYRIERELGRGSMAVVYRAMQLNLQRPVALKVLSPELASSQEFVGRFFNEARAAAALSHANIIQAYDAGLAGDATYYFAMEYVEGETVQDRIRREGPLPTRTALRMAADIADALDYGWQRQSLTHGDIKPENIMVNTEGETKLADFGLAKVDGHDFAGTGVMLTPLYASPEAIRGELAKGDCRGDIYSFGATLYHMLSGQPPFPGDETEQVLERHLHEQLTPLSDLVDDLTPGVSDFVGRLLAKDPGERLQDWGAVRTAVQDLGKRRAHHSPKMKVKVPVERRAADAPPSPRRTGPPVVLLALAATAAIALGVLVIALRSGGQGPASKPDESQTGARPAARTTDQTSDAPQPGAGAVPTTPRVDPAARKHVQELWEELQANLRRTEDDPERCVGDLREFEQAHRDVWLPPDFAVRLKDYQTAAAWRAANQKSEPPKVKPAPRPREPAHPEAAVDPVDPANPRELPQPRDVQREDDFVRLCAIIRTHPYRPGVSVDALVRRAVAWLAAYPEESDRRPIVKLVAESFLPALDECIPKLVANQKALVGKRIVLARKQDVIVYELSLARLTVYRKTAHGSLRKRLAWADLRDLQPLLMLYHLALGTKQASLADRRPYLALALISGDSSWWSAATAGLPDSPELRHWQTFRAEYAKAAHEGEALVVWDRVRQAFMSGDSDAEAYSLSRELRGRRTEVTTRHLAELDLVDRVCAESVPEVKAGRLVREVQDSVSNTPLQALQTLNLVRARYGALEFPERERLIPLREQALATIPRRELPAGRDAGIPWEALCSQLNGSWGSPPHATMVAFQDLASVRGQPMRLGASEPFVKLLALTELGDWAAAAAQLAECPATLPVRRAELTACTAFSAGLVHQRFPSRKLDFDPLVELRGLAAGQRLRRALRAQLATMCCEYAVIARRASELPHDACLFETLVPPLYEDSADFALASLTVHLEAGRHTDAARILGEFGSDQARFDAYRFSGFRRDFPQACSDFVATGKPIPPALMELPFANCERVLRLLVSVLCVHPDKAGDCPERLAAQLEKQVAGFGPLGGSAVYDLVCLRIAAALANKDLARAQAVANWGLAQTATALFPYYPRLLFLKAGLNRIGGDTSNQTSLAQRLRGTTVANHAETALANLLEPDYPAQRVVDAVRKHPAPNARFWFEWLLRSLEAAKAPQADRARIASSIYDRECSPAERLLTKALARYYLP